MNIESRQTIVEYAEAAEVYKLNSEYGTDDLMAMKADIRNLIALINDTNSTFTPQFGTGSPNSVVTSNYNRTYFDTTLSPVSVTMFVNENVGVNTGWVQVL